MLSSDSNVRAICRTHCTPRPPLSPEAREADEQRALGGREQAPHYAERDGVPPSTLGLSPGPLSALEISWGRRKRLSVFISLLALFLYLDSSFFSACRRR